MPPKTFDHERLTVYHRSIDFIVWSTELLDRLPKSLAVYSQLDRASSSIPLNIAEGTGKTTGPDRCRFFDISRGSAVECAACLDILAAKKLVSFEEASSGKNLLFEIVCTLVGLIRANDPNRLREDAPDYPPIAEPEGE
jgi:four helix bundle protein